MPALKKTAKAERARWLIGLIAEHQELAIRMAERPALLVLETDPLSGTTGLLELVLEDLDRPSIVVDARALGDAMELAMAIATEAITRQAPRAAGWWNGDDVVDAQGLQLAHALSTRGVDLERLRHGRGRGIEQLRYSLELAAALSEGQGLLAIDHLDDLLERLSRDAALTLLGALRAEHQRAGSVALLLVGRGEGRLASALRDPDHPLYRAGDTVRIRRPKPQRFRDDLAIGRPWTRASVSVIGAAAELASGSPAYVWRTVDLAPDQEGVGRVSALNAWRQLRCTCEPSTAQQFRLLGSVHRAAPTVVCAIASGVGPYESPLNPKSINDALVRMRARGQVFSPEKSRWAVSDPLLHAWARERAPLWVKRRTQHLGPPHD